MHTNLNNLAGVRGNGRQKEIMKNKAEFVLVCELVFYVVGLALILWSSYELIPQVMSGMGRMSEGSILVAGFASILVGRTIAIERAIINTKHD